MEEDHQRGYSVRLPLLLGRMPETSGPATAIPSRAFFFPGRGFPRGSRAGGAFCSVMTADTRLLRSLRLCGGALGVELWSALVRAFCSLGHRPTGDENPHRGQGESRPPGYVPHCHTMSGSELRMYHEGPMGTAPSPASNIPKGNRLLAALPEEPYQALLSSLEPVPLPLGTAVYESGARQGYVYFPTSGIVSLLYVLSDGASAEIAVTGNEGLVGIALFMGGETTPSRAVVQSAGHGYRLKAAVLKTEFERGGPLQHLLLR